MREHGPLTLLPLVAGTRRPNALRTCRDTAAVALAAPFCLISGLHDVVERLEHLGVVGRPPAAEGHDVVAGSRLGLGLLRQQQLVALGRDVVDLDLDLLLGRPLFDQRRARGIGGGHPMIPKSDRELACGMGAADVGHGNHGGGGGAGGKKAASRKLWSLRIVFLPSRRELERAAGIVLDRGRSRL